MLVISFLYIHSVNKGINHLLVQMLGTGDIRGQKHTIKKKPDTNECCETSTTTKLAAVSQCKRACLPFLIHLALSYSRTASGTSSREGSNQFHASAIGLPGRCSWPPGSSCPGASLTSQFGMVLGIYPVLTHVQPRVW